MNGKIRKILIIVLVCLALLAAGAAIALRHFAGRTNFRKDSDILLQTETETERTLHARDVYDLSRVVKASKEQTEGTYTLLVIGGDTPEAEAENQRNDAQAVILMVVNHNRGMCYFASMRTDLYVRIPDPEKTAAGDFGEQITEGVSEQETGRVSEAAGEDAESRKWPSEGSLGHAYALGGGPLLARTIEENYGIPVDNYASISLKDVARIIEIPEFEHLDISEEGLQVVKELIYSLNAVKPAQVAGYITQLLPYVTHNIAGDRMMKIILQVPAIVGYYSEEENIPYEGTWQELDGYVVPDLACTTQRMHEMIYG